MRGLCHLPLQRARRRGGKVPLEATGAADWVHVKPPMAHDVSPVTSRSMSWLNDCGSCPEWRSARAVGDAAGGPRHQVGGAPFSTLLLQWRTHRKSTTRNMYPHGHALGSGQGWHLSVSYLAKGSCAGRLMATQQAHCNSLKGGEPLTVKCRSIILGLELLQMKALKLCLKNALLLTRSLRMMLTMLVMLRSDASSDVGDACDVG